MSREISIRETMGKLAGRDRLRRTGPSLQEELYHGEGDGRDNADDDQHGDGMVIRPDRLHDRFRIVIVQVKNKVVELLVVFLEVDEGEDPGDGGQENKKKAKGLADAVSEAVERRETGCDARKERDQDPPAGDHGVVAEPVQRGHQYIREAGGGFDLAPEIEDKRDTEERQVKHEEKPLLYVLLELEEKAVEAFHRRITIH